MDGRRRGLAVRGWGARRGAEARRAKPAPPAAGARAVGGSGLWPTQRAQGRAALGVTGRVHASLWSAAFWPRAGLD